MGYNRWHMIDPSTVEQIGKAISFARKVTIITSQPPFPDSLFALFSLRNALMRLDKSLTLIAPDLDVAKSPGQLANLSEVASHVPLQHMVVRVGLDGNHVSRVSYEEKEGSVFVHIIPEQGVINSNDVEKVLGVSDTDLIITLGVHAPTDITGWPDGWSATINFDVDSHNAHYGKINVVDPDASSLCEIVFNLFEQLFWEIDTETAQLLYRGITNATRQFKQFVRPETFEVAAQLLRAGAKTKLEVESQTNEENSEQKSVTPLSSLAQPIDI